MSSLPLANPTPRINLSCPSVHMLVMKKQHICIIYACIICSWIISLCIICIYASHIIGLRIIHLAQRTKSSKSEGPPIWVRRAPLSIDGLDFYSKTMWQAMWFWEKPELCRRVYACYAIFSPWPMCVSTLSRLEDVRRHYGTGFHAASGSSPI